ncbi:YcaO-like family protein [Benzoatithermus flavus]|uniref:YcaO-like family protein n=1 Tax=Benzoatithermus flavus TaxID=3108223 RepID=A0ABU8XQ43_9PROT
MRESSGSPKRYWLGTHRIVDPEATVERVRGLLPAFGITRIADVTGLDRIGIPVAIVVRPNGRALAVAQGKGVTRPAAQASGLMESIEAWHAEQLVLPTLFNSIEELRYTHPLIDLARLPRRRGSRIDPHQRLLWVEGRDLLAEGGAALWLPRDLVSTDYTLPPPPGAGCFCASSNGLASGNDRAEALVQALCEVIERDAMALWRAAPAERRAATRIDAGEVDDPVCRDLLAALEAADIAVGIWDVTSDTGVAAFHVELAESGSRLPLFSPIVASGSGCHPARGVALARALTEAAQSRLTGIAGSRDDIDPRIYQPDGWQHAAWLDAVSTAEPQRPFAAVPDAVHPTAEADLAFLLARLRAIGIRQAAAVDLSREELFGLPVVRVVVPGLETDPRHPFYVPGPRARAAAAGGRA